MIQLLLNVLAGRESIDVSNSPDGQDLKTGSTTFTNFPEKIPALTELILHHKQYVPFLTPIVPLLHHLLPHLKVFDGPADLVSRYSMRPGETRPSEVTAAAQPTVRRFSTSGCANDHVCGVCCERIR